MKKIKRIFFNEKKNIKKIVHTKSPLEKNCPLKKKLINKKLPRIFSTNKIRFIYPTLPNTTTTYTNIYLLFLNSKDSRLEGTLFSKLAKKKKR